MEIEFKQNGVLTKTKLYAEPEKFISEHKRKWMLRSKEYKYIFISFEEDGGRLDTNKPIEKASEIEIDEEEIFGLLEDFIEKSIDSRKNGMEGDDDDDDTQPQPYDYNKISIKTDRWSLAFIHQMINDYKDLDLNPDFQRNYVWDTKRKSQLIESLMLNIPVPAFYLAESSKGRFQVVDGLQRLTTIDNFMNNKFPLAYLEYLNAPEEKSQEGLYFKDDGKKKGISPEFKKNILMTQINVNIIEAKSPAKVKFDVFRRVNTGGKPLNNQEIRNCLANKQTRALLKDLVKTEAFKEATGRSVRTIRMQAQELVLRFIGFWFERILGDSAWEYNGNMTGYLDEAIELLNKNGKENQKIEIAFERAMLNAHHLFGAYAFRKCLRKDLEPNARKQLINKSLFTTWSVVLSQYEHKKVKAAIEYGQFAYVLADSLENNAAFYNAVSYKTNDKGSFMIAFEETEKLVKNLMG
jgi:hypothetical protein